MGIQYTWACFLFRVLKFVIPVTGPIIWTLFWTLWKILAAILAYMAPRNIVIFGETGSGKSSIVNMLVGQNVAEVSDSAVGCTFNFQSYKSHGYTFYDTAGLSEGTQGTLTSKQALTSLVKLLKSLEHGVSMLIFVVEKGRIKSTLETNYKLFVNTICMKNVPVLLVVTHCEQSAHPGTWWLENKKHFDKYEMKFADTICGCASTGEGLLPIFKSVMKPRYDETKLALYKSIGTHILPKAWKMSSWPLWLGCILKRVWNVLCGFFNWNPIPYLPQLTQIFVEQGVDEKSATKLGNQLYSSVVP